MINEQIDKIKTYFLYFYFGFVFLPGCIIKGTWEIMYLILSSYIFDDPWWHKENLSFFTGVIVFILTIIMLVKILI